MTCFGAATATTAPLTKPLTREMPSPATSPPFRIALPHQPPQLLTDAKQRVANSSAKYPTSYLLWTPVQLILFCVVV